MRPYLDLLQQVLEHGERRTDRTGTGTLSLFGAQTRYDLRDGLPAGHHQEGAVPGGGARAAVVPARLDQHQRRPHAAHADLGRVGRRARRARPDLRLPVAELGRARGSIRSATRSRRSRRNPMSRRIIVSAWNVADLPKMKLPPCHALFQFYVARRVARLPALPALGGSRARRAVQHRELRAADGDDRAGVRARAAPLRAHARRRAHLPQPRRGREAPARARRRSRCRGSCSRTSPRSRSAFEDIALEGYQHHPFIKFPVAV